MTENMGKAEKFAQELLSRLSWNKKSVRTTFKLSEKATEMLAELTEREGKTIKDFFDTFLLALLITETPMPGQKHSSPLLPKLKDVDQKAEYSKTDRQILKTYVLSETGLTLLERYAKQYKMSRDAFVEYAVRFSKASLEKQIKEAKNKHAEAFEIVDRKWTELENTREEIKTLLGEGDPILERFGTVCIVMMNLHSEIEQELQDGTPIDPRGL
jgi:hypothetical protein